jgi:hypothetical protein
MAAVRKAPDVVRQKIAVRAGHGVIFLLSVRFAPENALLSLATAPDLQPYLVKSVRCAGPTLFDL